MRILHVHSGNLYGGVETILMTLARRQDACPEMQEQFALCFEGRLSRELAKVGAVTHPIGAVRVSRPLTVMRSRRQLRKLVAGRAHGGYDALVFHSAWSHAIFGSVAQRERLPAVVWVHGPTTGRHWTEHWSRRMNPDLVVCNSRFTASIAFNVYPNTPQHVLYCPLELNSAPLSSAERRNIRSDLNTPENAVVVVQVSRMERWKGQLLHLEALSKLRAVPNWVCWFVGGPQRPKEKRYFDEVQDAATRLGMDSRVRFLNECSDVKRVLGAADIYCQPNLSPEPFGITFVEALNARLPVVTTRMGGPNEILNDACGMLAAPGNATEIADRLRRLIEDRALRQRLGQAGPARAKELCDPAARIKDLSELLLGVVSRSS